MGRKRMILDEEKPKLRQSETEVGRENQLIALAYDEVERRLRNGTASSQETVHFLKLGSSKAKLEIERLKKENEVLAAKADSLRSEQHSRELFEEAMKAFGIYTGQVSEEDNENGLPRLY